MNDDKPPTIAEFTRRRRDLPHWQQPGSIYFLTWRLLPIPELTPTERQIVFDAILFWNERRWQVFAAVVMPDHVHALARPLEVGGSGERRFHDLSGLLKSVKSYSSREIGKQIGRLGSVWQDETFDRIVRDDEELYEKWTYIRNNAVRAGLSDRPEGYHWLYEADGKSFTDAKFI